MLWVSSMGLRWRNGLLKAWWISKQRSSICLLASHIPTYLNTHPSGYGLYLRISRLCEFSHCNCVSVWEKKRRERVVFRLRSLEEHFVTCFWWRQKKRDPHTCVYIVLTMTRYNHWHLCSPARVVGFLEGRIPVFCEGKDYICLIERGPLEPSDHIKEAQKQSP